MAHSQRVHSTTVRKTWLQGEAAGHTASSQEVVSLNVGAEFTFSFFIQSGPPAHGIMLPSLREGLHISVNVT